ncbi:MAG: carbon storage regulator CsrA [Nitriliruptoraceae bacterium]
MLVLSRRLGESIVIGNEIVVRIVDVRGDQVRLGIEAPRDVQIHREEVFLELQAENESAAVASARTQGRVANLPRPAAGGTPGQRPVRPMRPLPKRGED